MCWRSLTGGQDVTWMTCELEAPHLFPGPGMCALLAFPAPEVPEGHSFETEMWR